MAAKEVKSVAELGKELEKVLLPVKKAILGALVSKIKDDVVEDYQKRVQTQHYPLRNPITGDMLDSMPPSDIARFIIKTAFTDRALVYLPPGTEADRSGRMQELYGGRPWQRIRQMVQKLEYAKQALQSLHDKKV